MYITLRYNSEFNTYSQQGSGEFSKYSRQIIWSRGFGL